MYFYFFALARETGDRNIDISSVVEFQRWWVLKSKLFAQESTCSKEILMPTSLSSWNTKS